VPTRKTLMNKNGTLGIIITLSIAMVGATIMSTYGLLQAEANKPAQVVRWCYDIGTGGEVGCFLNNGDCKKAQESDEGSERLLQKPIRKP
jgi:hypothetical protein